MKSSRCSPHRWAALLSWFHIALAALVCDAEDAGVDLLIVAGQSNAVGYDARPSELPPDARDADIRFWWRCGDPPPDEHDSTSGGQWTFLQAQPRGNPRPSGEDRQYGNFSHVEGGFGPEMGFARTLAAHGKKPLAVVKVAFSGTGAESDWNPHDAGEGGACYRALTAEIQAASRAAKAAGIRLEPRALAWIQGESDANPADAERYAGRLQKMLSALRADLGAPGLMATLAVNTHYGVENSFVPTIVRQQQLAAARDPRCAYVDTSAASNVNNAHFDATGTLDVGRWMAEALLRLESRLDPMRPALHMVVLGDSITAGVRSGVQPHETFAARWAEQLRSSGVSVQMTNAGRGGETTDQGLARIESVVALRPDVVTVMYGTNDSYVDQGQNASRLPLDAYRSNLDQIVVRLLRAGILPVVMTEPRWADEVEPNGISEHPNVRLEAYMDACRGVARQRRVPLVDHFANWTTAREQGVELRDWTTDGCHPNPLGHARLADALARQAIPEGRVGVSKRRALLEGRPFRVVCFGDSVTGIYYHTGSRRAYSDLIGEALRRIAPQAPIETINAGVSGETTHNGLDRLDRDVLSRRPDVVTVMFGLNDMTRMSTDDFRRNLATIVEKCRDAGADVVLATPNNVVDTSERPADKLALYCDVVREVGRKKRAPVCDVYREFEALRAQDEFDWRLHMSDEIHPNMHGHRSIAEQLTQSITGIRVDLSDASPPDDVAVRTRALLGSKRPMRILAMPPLDEAIESALKSIDPAAVLEMTPWQVEGMSLEEIEQDAKRRVRPMSPDLVAIALPRSALMLPRSAHREEETKLVRSLSWIMNWSLAFGSPTWDCVVVHPSVWDPIVASSDADAPPSGDDLLRRLVAAQDLALIDRPSGSDESAAVLVRKWFEKGDLSR